MREEALGTSCCAWCSPGRPSPAPREDARGIPGSPLNISPFPRSFQIAAVSLPDQTLPISGPGHPSLPGWGTEVLLQTPAANPFAPGWFLLHVEKQSSRLSPCSGAREKQDGGNVRESEKGAGKARPGFSSCRGRTRGAGAGKEHLSPRGCCLSPAASTVSPRPLVTPAQLCPAPPCPQKAAAVRLLSSNPKSPSPNPALGPSPLSCSPQRLGAAAFLPGELGNRRQPQWDAGESQTHRNLLFQEEKVPPCSEQAESPQPGSGLSRARSWRGVPCALSPLLPL